MKIVKKIYEIKNINKINKWMATIGVAMILLAIYFLFKKGYNQMFLLGTFGLTILGENTYLIFINKKMRENRWA